MADTQWTGGANTSWTDNANWTGSAPANNDSAYLTAAAPTNDPTTNMDINTVGLTDLVIGGSFTGNIGTGADPLRCAADRLQMDGTGTLFFRADDGTGSDWLTTFIQNNGRVILDATPLAAELVALCQVNRGTLIIKDGIFTTLTVNTGGATSGTHVTIESAVNSVATMNQSGGIVRASVGPGTVNISSGKFIIEGSAAITTLNILGGEVDWRSSGVLTTVNQFGGVFTAANTTQNGAVTITTYNGYKGRADLRTGRGQVTVTNPVNINGKDFRLLTDSNKKLTIADQ